MIIPDVVFIKSWGGLVHVTVADFVFPVFEICLFISLMSVLLVFHISSRCGETVVLGTTWKCEHLGSALKRGKVMSRSKQLYYDIIIYLFLFTINSHSFQWTEASKSSGQESTRFIFESMVIDPGGNYILVSGFINSFPLVVLNIYAPNFDFPVFFAVLILCQIDLHPKQPQQQVCFSPERSLEASASNWEVMFLFLTCAWKFYHNWPFCYQFLIIFWCN